MKRIEKFWIIVTIVLFMLWSVSITSWDTFLTYEITLIVIGWGVITIQTMIHIMYEYDGDYTKFRKRFR